MVINRRDDFYRQRGPYLTLLLLYNIAPPRNKQTIGLTLTFIVQHLAELYFLSTRSVSYFFTPEILQFSILYLVFFK